MREEVLRRRAAVVFTHRKRSDAPEKGDWGASGNLGGGGAGEGESRRGTFGEPLSERHLKKFVWLKKRDRADKSANTCL